MRIRHMKDEQTYRPTVQRLLASFSSLFLRPALKTKSLKDSALLNRIALINSIYAMCPAPNGRVSFVVVYLYCYMASGVLALLLFIHEHVHAHVHYPNRFDHFDGTLGLAE